MFEFVKRGCRGGRTDGRGGLIVEPSNVLLLYRGGGDVASKTVGGVKLTTPF